MVSLSPTKQKLYKRHMRATDIETYGVDNKFVVNSLFCFVKDNCNRIKPYMKFSFTKKQLHDEMKKLMHHNSDFYATNLGFDFHGCFFNTKEAENFTMRYNGSHLQFCKTYIKNGKFNHKKPDKKGRTSTLTFEDSLNHTQTSVKELGKMIGIAKGEQPHYLGKRKPETEEEWRYYLRYNMIDSIITYFAMKFLIKAYEELGATKKSTIASTSMSKFKNKHLKEKYRVQEIKDLVYIFEGYTGGHIEVFSRGCVKGQNLKLFDVKAMYPFQMCKVRLPNPNKYSVCTIPNKCIKYIRGSEGMSDVEIVMPKNKFCLLPVRSKEGLKFKYGKIRGKYTHILLRKAIEEGGIITKIHSTMWYADEIVDLFYDYVMELFNARIKYKKENNIIMAHACKIFTNSLYGKFAQKFLHKGTTIHESQMTQEIFKKNHCVRIGNTRFFRVYEDTAPACFCHPIWSAYITDCAKIYLHELLVKYDGKYCDTDSIVTDKFPTECKPNAKIGELEFEMNIDDGFIVRKKLYCFKGTDIDGKIKYKCAGKGIQIPRSIFNNVNEKDYEKAVYEFMYDKIKNGMKFDASIDDDAIDFHFERMLKMNEALRRGLCPNYTISGIKKISVNDTNRIWANKFSTERFEEKSEPFENEIIAGVNYDKQREDRTDRTRSDRRIIPEIQIRRMEKISRYN